MKLEPYTEELRGCPVKGNAYPVLVLGIGNPLMGDDGAGVELAHRLGREAKVLAGLQKLAAAAPVDEAALVAEVYADTPKQLHAMALRSLRAHLHKLQAEGRASRRGDQWQLSA